MTDPKLRLTQIWIYPVKSLGGIRVKSARVCMKGLQYDRRYMLADAQTGIALTQREHPKMALFKTAINGGNLTISYSSDSLTVPLEPANTVQDIPALVWGSRVLVKEVSREFSEWFSSRLGTECKLVFFPEANARPVETEFQIDGEHVSLADAYPLLIIGEEGLRYLNSKLAEPVGMDRFRPNIVFSGGEPHAEDGWRNFSVAQNKFAAVKPCARCILTTVNQQSGVKGTEPLKTLASYRTRNNKVYFGQNVLVLSGGVIREGDPINVES